KSDRSGFRVTRPLSGAKIGEALDAAPPEPAVDPKPSGPAAAAPPHTAAAAAEGVPPGPVNFSTFVIGLSTQALLHLGEIANPMTNAVERDLEAAKHVIDILGILQEKTRNNLDAGEETLLSSVLYDLRM